MKSALFLLSCGLAFGACANPPYANGYTYCRELVIDHTKVPSTQTNFPMVVCFDTTMGANCSANALELATVAHGGSLINASGFDFIFTSDNAGSTPIAYERAIQNTTTGAAELWVLIASLSSSADTKIYLFYQNVLVTTDQSNGTAVWDANYKAVQHFNALSGNITTVTDSTSVGNDITRDGLLGSITGSSGIIGGAALWSGFSGLANGSPTGMPTGSGTRTLELWVISTATGNPQAAMCIGNNSTDGRFTVELHGSPNTWAVEGTNVAASYPASVGSWHHIALTLPGGSTTFMGTLPYVDGVLQTLSNINNWTDTVNTVIGDYRIGNGCGTASFILTSGAMVDEARVSNIARSADWILAEYNNQNSPNTFYTISGQDPASISIPRTIIIN